MVARAVVLLHGFGSTGAIFAPITERLSDRYAVHHPDLPGHGAARGALAREPETPAFAEVVDYLAQLLPERFTLLGYSLGGRIALQFALAFPHRLERLVLVSTTAGIEDALQRQARRQSDLAWAKALETEPYDAFIERWRSQPLFAGEPPAAAARSRSCQLENDPLALAAVMRRLGTGSMEPLWGRLGELQMEALCVAGSRDERYLRIAKRLADALPHGRLQVIEGGHNLVAEAPEALADLL